ncbi:unnamed protein product [Linum tenue]|uniref:Uncharacterized protein n=1 Tax=Linum tenue TaxID=586396 RepID=A0AAV0L4M0_9ROSI|nr:unnamed protein product [Linum tenue]
MLLLIMLVMGMMVESSNASYQQCFVRCLRTCIFDVACTFRCGTNCFLTDPIHTDHKNNDNNNVKFCNLGCLATALIARDPSGNHRFHCFLC